jgi:hypothetical protein
MARIAPARLATPPNDQRQHFREISEVSCFLKKI